MLISFDDKLKPEYHSLSLSRSLFFLENFHCWYISFLLLFSFISFLITIFFFVCVCVHLIRFAPLHSYEISHSRNTYKHSKMYTQTGYDPMRTILMTIFADVGERERVIWISVYTVFRWHYINAFYLKCQTSKLWCVNENKTHFKILSVIIISTPADYHRIAFICWMVHFTTFNWNFCVYVYIVWYMHIFDCKLSIAHNYIDTSSLLCADWYFDDSLVCEICMCKFDIQ